MYKINKDVADTMVLSKFLSSPVFNFNFNPEKDTQVQFVGF